MNKITKILTGTAVTIALGVGLILGNAALVSFAMGTDNPVTKPVIEPDSSANPGARTGNVVVMGNMTSRITYMARGWENLPGDKADDVLNLQIEEKERLLKEKLRASGFTEEEIAMRIEEIRNALKNPVYVEGKPGANDIAAEKAVEIARSAIMEKYALTDDTLKRFSIYSGFNVADPENPKWHVSFYPTDKADYAEIGCYNVILDPVTGKIISITSAADGRG